MKRVKREPQPSESENTDVTALSTPIVLAHRRPVKRIKKIDVYDHFDSCIEIFDAIRTIRDGNDRLVSDTFFRTPSRRTDMDYYKQVEKPIDISRIQQKLKSGDYASLKEFCNDVELLINNAKIYYKEGSDEYSHAQILLAIYESERDRILQRNNLVPSCSTVNRSLKTSPSPSLQSKSSGKRTPTPSNASESWRFEAAIVSILQLTDDENRLVSPPFRVLDPPEEFPDYYQRIKNPLDLKTICKRIRMGEYTTWTSLETDVKLMCQNAKVFNPPESKIHKDADFIVEFFSTKIKTLADCRKLTPKEITSNRQTLDNLIKSSDSEANEFTEDSEEDEDSELDSDSKWLIYWKIRNFHVVNGIPACEPFLELPSKRSYPDYYEEIERPMSLFMINKKLKRQNYDSVQELVSDLLLIFDNARSYNMEDSPIYRAAEELRKLTIDSAAEFERNLLICKGSDTVSDLHKEKEGNNEAISDIRTENEEPKAISDIRTENEDALSSNLISNDAITSIQDVGASPSNSTFEEDKIEVVKEFKPTTLDQIQREQLLVIPSNSDTSLKRKRIRRPPGAPPGRKGRPPKQRPIDESKPTTSFAHEKIQTLCATKGKPGRRSFDEMKEIFTKKMLEVWTNVRDLQVGARVLSEPFLYLPCDETYPDYYKTIKNPIDLTTMQAKIQQSKYKNSEEILADFRLMFSNARTYNRPNSQIFTDSSILESVAVNTMNSLTKDRILYFPGRKPRNKDTTPCTPRKRNHKDEILNDLGNTPNTELEEHIDESAHTLTFDSSKNVFEEKEGIPELLFDLLAKPEKRLNTLETNREQKQMQTIFDELLLYRDEDGRLLSEWFLELPTEKDEYYAEYYETIKKPMDLTKVAARLNSNQYESWRILISDLKLVFENACKFNEPDSPIYKDALAMLKELIHLKREFFDDDEIQSVQIQVKHILSKLLESVINHRDANGAYMINSLKKVVGYEQITHDPNSSILEQTNHFTFEQIQKNLQQGRYRRLDRFQEDLFLLFSWIRHNSEADSETFLNSIELQRHYLKVREDLCKGILSSPASLYVNSQLEEEVEALVKSKRRRLPGLTDDNGTNKKSIISNIIAREVNSKPPIIVAENCSAKTENNNHASHPPEAAVHVELANGDIEESVLIRPLSPLDITRREVLQKLPSSSDNDMSGFPFFAEGNIYYQQLGHNGRYYRLGDGVLIYRNDKPHCDVMRIDRLWKTKSGEKMFSGSRFARPHECRHEPSRMFYVCGGQLCEVFGVKQLDSVEKIDHVQGKCAILTLKQYESCRPTEIPECDVFIVDQKVLGPVSTDNDGNIIPLTCKNCSLNGRFGDSLQCDDFDLCRLEMDLDNTKPLRKLKQYKLSHEVVEDEIFYFKTPLIMERVLLSPMVKTEAALPIARHELEVEERHINQRTVSRYSPAIQTQNAPTLLGTLAAPNDSMCPSTSRGPNSHPNDHDQSRQFPVNGVTKDSTWLESQPKLNARSKSGYILFSAEVRKRVMHENPDAGFGEVSRLVGVEWKKLSDEHKRQYEARAHIIAEERTKAELQSPAKMLQPGQVRVYVCKWVQCDFQFESADGLSEHTKYHAGQVDPGDNQYVCLWQSCLKYRKEGKPFPSLNRLHRHIREKHISAASRIIQPEQRIKNHFVYIPSTSSKNDGSSSKHHDEPKGMFLHKPFGQQTSPNATPCAIATPTPEHPPQQTKITLNAGVGTPKTLISTPTSSALSSTPYPQTMVQRLPPSTPISAVLNGMSSTGSATTHYIVQQPTQTPQSSQQTFVLPSGLQSNNAVQQLVPTNIGGATVLLPAGAQYQTLILNPALASTSSATQQIILHPPPQQNMPSAAYIHQPPPQHHQHHAMPSVSQQQHVYIQQHQQHSTTSSMALQTSMINGLPPQGTTFLATTQSSSGTGAQVGSTAPAISVPASIQQMAHPTLPPQTPTPHHQPQIPPPQTPMQPSTSSMPQPQPQIGGTSSTTSTIMHAQQLQSHQTAQAHLDAGRTVVHASAPVPVQPPEPVFVAQSNSVQVRRALHSEAYVRYIETMYKQKQRTVSKWDKSLSASHRNTLSNNKKLPYDWINKKPTNGMRPREDELLRSLWRLRDHMLEVNVGIDRSNLTSIDGTVLPSNQQS